ncbi:kinase-like domain-containing protein [Rhizophagus irregularis DAOM 181602=DAOM 197198]|nr:kinase-like domain-containing protein [Rhizophagus irregularis DAOM 181602=DAOM 197198]
MQNSDNNNKSDWIEEAIAKEYLKYYEYKNFSDVKKIGGGEFVKVYHARWKNTEQYFALKSFKNSNSEDPKQNEITIKEIVDELKVQRDVVFHDNIIKFYGITVSKKGIFNNAEYSLALVFWELTSCKSPFDYETKNNDYQIMLEIHDGKRENPIPNTNSKFTKNRKRARAQQVKNGTIYVTELGAIGDDDKDRLEKHFTDRSRDITFYDIPAYWSDDEIFQQLRDNVGFVEYMRTKKCYKYKTVRVTLRFSNEYEKIYKEGGVNVPLTRNGRQYFIRMFDSRLSYRNVKEKFRWQAVKRLDSDVQKDDVLVIKEYIKTYKAFFGKIIRVKGTRFIILYFIKEMDLMNAINESIKNNDLGQSLWIKKECDYIDENGELQELNR